MEAVTWIVTTDEIAETSIIINTNNKNEQKDFFIIILQKFLLPINKLILTCLLVVKNAFKRTIYLEMKKDL
jgi:hypothetical protein